MLDYVVQRLNREMMVVETFGEPSNHRDKMSILMRATDSWVTPSELAKFLKGNSLLDVLEAYNAWFNLEVSEDRHRFGFIKKYLSTRHDFLMDVQRLRERLEA